MSSYNGWSNYETWNAKLWIDNDGRSDHWDERAREVLAGADFDKDSASQHLAEELEAESDEFRPEVAGMYADLLTSALGRINWREIADSFLSDIEVYSAGWNMPGCLPDSDPARFLDADEARDYIATEMERDADMIAEEGGLDAEAVQANEQINALTAAMEACRAGSGEYGATVGRYHYFVTKL